MSCARLWATCDALPAPHVATCRAWCHVQRMIEKPHILSALVESEADAEADARLRHAAAQRQYARRRRRKRAPRAEDITRAVTQSLHALLKEREATSGLSTGEAALLARVVGAAVDHLVARGFDAAEVRRRMKRTLHPLR